MPRLCLCIILNFAFAAGAFAEHGGGPHGRGPHGPRHGQDQRFDQDRQVFWYLIDNRQDIQRTVKNLENGVESTTESARPEVAQKIQQHFEAMQRRLKEGRPIHQRDPLFAELFRHGQQIDFEVNKTDKGVHIRETSNDPYVAKLIQAHAKTVSDFLQYGHAEVRKDHPVPERG